MPVTRGRRAIRRNVRGRRRAVSTRGRGVATTRQAANVGTSQNFNWTDGMNFVPNSQHFDSSSSGIKNCDIDRDTGKEIDYFLLYFDTKVIEIIVTETNNYRQFKFENFGEEFSPNSHMRRWHDTNMREMYTFLALTILMSHSVKHK